MHRAMAIITFKFTKEEFLSGQKTVTRRDWKRTHMQKWQRWYDEGRRVHDAYDQLPIAGGKKFGEFRLTCRPYWEKLEDMPEKDLDAEGGMCDTKKGFYGMIGLPPDHEVAVIRFEKLDP